jgi:hypothetical protein
MNEPELKDLNTEIDEIAIMQIEGVFALVGEDMVSARARRALEKGHVLRLKFVEDMGHYSQYVRFE